MRRAMIFLAGLTVGMWAAIGLLILVLEHPSPWTQFAFGALLVLPPSWMLFGALVRSANGLIDEIRRKP